MSNSWMNGTPVRYAVLRHQRVWDGVTLAGLQADTDGGLILARVPGVGYQPAIRHPSPYEMQPSGIALGKHGDVYVADTAGNQIVYIMGGCDDNKLKIGPPPNGAASQFSSPRGLLISTDMLHIADSANARVLVFQLPTLEVRAVWQGLFEEPTGLASDSQGRIYVLDVLDAPEPGIARVLRFDSAGAPDAAYNTAMSLHPELEAPIGIAIGTDDVLYVADQKTNVVLPFDPAGKLLPALPQSGAPVWPRALAARSDRLYAADARSGWIRVYQAGQGWIGTVPRYRGPVSGMTLDLAGRLSVKPGLDDAFHILDADTAYVSSGTLTAGPFDAGQESDWERVHAEVESPIGETELRVFTSNSAGSSPSENDWTSPATLAPALDSLIPAAAAAPAVPGTKRFAWVRVRLSSSDPAASPRLSQIELATEGGSYLEFLPAVYRRADAPTRFLERWLSLVRSRLGDWNLELDEISRRSDPTTAPEETLPSLAHWLGFDLPPEKDAEQWRRLLNQAYRLYERRGTGFGIRQFCEMYTGARPHIIEAFHQRHVWQLGQTSYLGFDTALAPSSPDGMIVPGFPTPDPALRGLRGDYYAGINFDQLKATRVDGEVNYSWGLGAPIEDVVPAEGFSVRWTGQLQPRYSELYTFHTTSDDGVRLFIDGRLIIDNWTDHAPTENRAMMALIADRWYPVTLEYYEKSGGATISLAWSSLSQIKEVIPQTCLYAIRDESAGRREEAGAGSGRALLVGQAIVGATGPLEKSGFGTPLFDDTAHLFTVLLPAARLPTLRQREEFRRILEAEKPAHTDFHLCFVEPRMRVGFQARVGIDSIVAGSPEAMTLSGTVLGRDSYLADSDEDDDRRTVSRVGKHALVGRDAVVG
jgi:phage tail-like protein